MKKVAVATTTSSGAAVSSSSATAVQSVYIAVRRSGRRHHLSAPRVASMTRWLVVLLLIAGALPSSAGVEFTDCQPASGGGVTCDTRPTGNTLMDDEAARYGLFDEASPGWSEYDPYEGYDDMFGGNWT